MSKTFDFELCNSQEKPIELAIEPWGMVYALEKGQTIRVSIEMDGYLASKPPSLHYGENLISLWIEGSETFRFFQNDVEIDPEMWNPTSLASVYELQRAA